MASASLAALLCVAHLPSAQAQEDGILATFKECATITDDLERLACFDQALVTAEESAKLAEEEFERQIELTKQEAEDRFGFLADPEPEQEEETETAEREEAETEEAGQAEAEAAAQATAAVAAVRREQERAEALREAGKTPKESTGEVVAVWRLPSKRFAFRLEDGQVWKQTGGGSTKLAPHLGARVKIKKARFGVFKMWVDGKRGFVTVQRVK